MKKILIILIIVVTVSVLSYIYLPYLAPSSKLSNVVNKVATIEESENNSLSDEERFGESFIRARDIKRQRDRDKLVEALALYYLDNKQNPQTLNELVPDYLPEIPVDPQTLEVYKGYRLINNQKDFEICVELEDTESVNYPEYCSSSKHE